MGLFNWSERAETKSWMERIGLGFSFSMTGLLVVVGLFGFGYAMRPVQEIFDDLHDSKDDSEDDDSEDAD